MAEESVARKRLGEMLIQAKLLTPEELERALELQRSDYKRLGDILVEQGMVSPENLAMTLSLHLNLPLMDLKRHKVQPDALHLIPEEMARRHNLIPLDIIDGALGVVMDDPADIQVIEELTARAGMPVRPMVGVRPDIEAAIHLYYKAKGEIEERLTEIAPPPLIEEVEEKRLSAEAIAQAPVVRAVDLMLQQAVKDHASDIHLEPEEDGLRVRYRIDGILHDGLSLPKSAHAPLVSRIKIMAGMNIAERRRPQDGQFAAKIGGEEIFFRVATSDTAWGEMAALRVLDRSIALLELSELGFQAASLDTYRRMLLSPFGMILVSGPTGSGKTTTLYASINQLNREELNIMTIEDPIEYNFRGINQIQVNRLAGIDFATGLRAIVRLDPDVILVGEIRDSETSETAVNAALAGQLVLSSVHSNDAVGALFRLLDLGVEPFLLVSAVIGVVAQRLVRSVCSRCRTLAPPPPEEQFAYEKEMGETAPELHYGEGCNFCSDTGYRGRTGVFEVLVVSEEIRRLLLKGSSASEVKAQALKEGMIPMWRDGMMKVKEGITTPYEVIRNVYTLS